MNKKLLKYFTIIIFVSLMACIFIFWPRGDNNPLPAESIKGCNNSSEHDKTQYRGIPIINHEAYSGPCSSTGQTTHWDKLIYDGIFGATAGLLIIFTGTYVISKSKKSNNKKSINN